ncbi:hypothetical protein PHYC_01738 [Phycisphaerales bacterium]|nr:hypothetical protein PHYC_01738 [Phycisphaerales bacterium]
MKRSLAIAVVATSLLPASVLSALQPEIAPAPAAALRVSPRQLAESRLARPATLEFNDQRLEDVLNEIIRAANVQATVMWRSDADPSGLDPDVHITVKSVAGTFTDLVERVLAQSTPDAIAAADFATWQFTESGDLQLGPRARLNAFKRVEAYPVRDLLQARFDFVDAPEIDLQAALQAGDGGSMGAIFRDTSNAESLRSGETLEDRAQRLIELIQDTIEPAQWPVNGGDAAAIRPFQDSLVVSAPDYIHRQIASGTARP